MFGKSTKFVDVADLSINNSCEAIIPASLILNPEALIS
jgi:hypothetical protein